MDFGADIAASVIAQWGETFVLRRAGQADLTVKGKRHSLNNVEIAGTVDDAELTVKISNAEIAASAAPTQFPRKGDTIGPFLITACDTRKVGDTVAVHILAVAGGSV